jgi:hypothetical protein
LLQELPAVGVAHLSPSRKAFPGVSFAQIAAG